MTADPLPRVNIVHGEIEQRRRLAAAGLADQVEMALALLARERDAAAGCICCDDGFGLHRPGQPPVRTPATRCGRRHVEFADGPSGSLWWSVPTRYSGAVPECAAREPLVL